MEDIGRPLTKLEKGVFVTISEDELENLKSNHSGFLSREYYPDLYEDISIENEIGRFSIFRLLKKI